MTTEENIRALSRRVTNAPENSKEFRAVMEKLRGNLKERAARGREQLAEFQKALRTPARPSIQVGEGVLRGQ